MRSAVYTCAATTRENMTIQDPRSRRLPGALARANLSTTALPHGSVTRATMTDVPESPLSHGG